MYKVIYPASIDEPPPTRQPALASISVKFVSLVYTRMFAGKSLPLQNQFVGPLLPNMAGNSPGISKRVNLLPQGEAKIRTVLQKRCTYIGSLGPGRYVSPSSLRGARTSALEKEDILASFGKPVSSYETPWPCANDDVVVRGLLAAASRRRSGCCRG